MNNSNDNPHHGVLIPIFITEVLHNCITLISNINTFYPVGPAPSTMQEPETISPCFCSISGMTDHVKMPDMVTSMFDDGSFL